MRAKFIFESLSDYAVKYKDAVKKYKPAKIKTLLIGEAPPPPTEKNPNPNYFYIVPKNRQGHAESLPGRVFKHYFGDYAQSTEDYENKLDKLRDMGIFLIDIVEEPITVKAGRGVPENPESIQIIKEALPRLKKRIHELGISEKDVIFLIPKGRSYERYAKKLFTDSKFYGWREFSEL